MGKVIELKRVPILNSDGDLLGYNVISVDLDDLDKMFELSSKEIGIDPKTTKRDEIITVLKRMGYEEYFKILEKEEKYKCLSEM